MRQGKSTWQEEQDGQKAIGRSTRSSPRTQENPFSPRTKGERETKSSIGRPGQRWQREKPQNLCTHVPQKKKKMLIQPTPIAASAMTDTASAIQSQKKKQRSAIVESVEHCSASKVNTKAKGARKRTRILTLVMTHLSPTNDLSIDLVIVTPERNQYLVSPNL